MVEMHIQRTMSDELNTHRVDKCNVTFQNILDIPVYRIQVGPHFYDGIVAQDIEALIPQSISEVNGRKIVDYNMIVGPLLNAFQEYVEMTNKRLAILETNMQLAIELMSSINAPRRKGVTRIDMGTNEAKWEG